jgi:subtilisin-like proprotein convertase family protein
MVSGTVALLLEANPNLTWRDVKHILARTARKLEPGLEPKSGSGVVLEAGWVSNAATPTGYDYSNAYGFGAVNVDAAMTMALQWKTDNTTLPAFKMISTGPVTESITVPDNNATGITRTLAAVEAGVVESVTLTLSLEETATGDIDISDYQIILESPAGTQSILLTPFNAYKAGFEMINLTLISHAFYGEDMAGDWKLIIRDLDAGGEVQLTQWSLKFYGH